MNNYRIIISVLTLILITNYKHCQYWLQNIGGVYDDPT